MDYYELLGVAPDAPVEEIHRAYQARARRVHPDRHAGDAQDIQESATRAMAQLNEAWSVLSDPQRRAAYNHTLPPRHVATVAKRRRRVPGLWVLGLAVVLAITLLAVLWSGASETPADRGNELAEFENRCVDLTADGERIVRPVDCTGTEDARVVAIPPAGEPCPRPADALFIHERSGRALCVTTRRAEL